MFWLAYSGKAIHRIYPTQAQEAFLEGHVEAFTALGGIPTRHIRYDNLSSAVTTVLYGTGRRRVENERWLLFHSAYGFDPFYCQPGLAGSHEKGGVEGEVGRFHRIRLTPMPVVDSLDELNDRIKAGRRPRTTAASATGSAPSVMTSPPSRCCSRPCRPRCSTRA